MPLYHHLQDWNGLDVRAFPLESWRKKFPFWPYFVGQKVRLELHVAKPSVFEKSDLQFHMVEKIAGETKPTILALNTSQEQASGNHRVFYLESGSLITGKGEIRYWLSNRGYNVDHEPVFTAEAINLDSFIVPIALMILGPLLGFLAGIVVGLVVGG
jgi:hypothetical protein